MKKASRPRNPRVPTARESLAQVNKSLSLILDALCDAKGDFALWGILEALNDIAEYGPGKAPKEKYAWRH